VVRIYFFSLLILLSNVGTSQKVNKQDKQLQHALQLHITYLASDLLEGRRTGTAGEKLAAEYISKAFKEMGLSAKGTSEYLQHFEIAEGRQVNTTTRLNINGTNLVLHKDFFPLSYSANATVVAMPSMSLQESGVPWFLNLKDLLEENKNNPHFDLAAGIQNKVTEMARRGANAVILYNTSSTEDQLAFAEKDKTPPLSIPVIYFTKSTAAKYLADPSASLDMDLKVDIGAKKRQGMNVIGFIDNGAAHTVVLGAHYDHLGWGEDGNTMLRNGTKEIHNGADDNASGTAALIEIARALKASKNKQNNYLFIAFSGEELGLYGSRFFVENPTINLGTINYMINMDMLGRLNDSSKTITVGGYGTSPLWGELYNASGKNKLYNANLLYRFDSSGTGPSDHTSFYRKDIPVLFYFTGLHTDYHRPSDDFDKINYAGEMHIVKHILSLIEATGRHSGKLVFTKTREAQTTTSARFSVSMGIMPDYTFSGAGVRVDGVSEGRAAQKAGLKTGDVITALGENKINSVEAYMQALSRYKKGDKTQVSYLRGKEQMTVTIEF
jgi:Zn-dependent M28 family amino/carboxypeptidase